MGKIKSHKASSKRFSLTGTGKVKINHTNRRHKLGKKSTKRKRGLRAVAYADKTNAKVVKLLIPYK